MDWPTAIVLLAMLALAAWVLTRSDDDKPQAG